MISCLQCNACLYTPKDLRVHWHPPLGRAICLSDITIVGILWKVGLLIIDHPTFESACWGNGIEEETHGVLLIHPPGGGQRWADEADNGPLDLCGICNAPVILIHTLLYRSILLVAIVSSL